MGLDNDDCKSVVNALSVRQDFVSLYRNKGEKMKYYIVWVGGMEVYEDIDKNMANYIGDKYISWGYDDVIIEKIKE